ncbi:hemolysin family protein [Siccirubricoccus sp. KC 17139]|uniref:Hemolysin family protein n=1 Tax=Siccirubricoccus soli TaxID=2899147 RepID=A0ABT1D1U8_9PROT|nr:hemolysin family protein [Siccirubricoccus soli]MCO6415893.1 hemolysin family protein [Siccirubricoccus soli]MCP2682025.1 hemolysin family protein [Siccirubricoccus soli]
MSVSNGEQSRREGILWRLQGLLRKREAESVRDRMEELIEEEPREHRPGDPGRDADDDLDAQERALLGNVLKLRGKTALDVMVPRADIMAMPEDFTLEQAIRLIQRDGHSRYPVFRGQLDEIVGMVHIKDVFAAVGREGPFEMKAILRKPLFVVPSVPVLDLLLQMRTARIHMALVVDEYGGIDGLVTIEDLVETITGDISDEHDEDVPPQMVERPDGTIELDARTPVELFESRMGPVLTDEERAADIDTMGGLVFTLAGRVPAKGELVSHSSGLEFRVLDADPRRIRKLRVRRPGAQGGSQAQKQAAE